MAYREHGMWEVLDVLQRAGRGQSLKAIARSVGVSRNTIKRYLKTAKGFGWTPETTERLEEIAARVLSRRRPGRRERSAGATTAVLLDSWRERLRTWLASTSDGGEELTLTKCHELLERRGVTVPYSSLHRYAVKHCGFGGPRITVRMAETAPGEVVEVDFGKLGLIPAAPISSKRRTLYALVVTLSCSRHQYVHVTHSQKLEDLIAGMEDAWEFFGGVTARVVLDNLKAAVVKADRYEPVFNRTFAEYARHRGFVIDPTRSRDPTGKPKVERQVPYVRRSYFQGEEFRDRDDAQRRAVKWCLETAGDRIHGTTRKHPLEEFEQHERSALEPLTGERFDTPRWGRVKVHPDHHIRFGKALYSLPTEHIGKEVDIRADSGLVRIYHAGELLKTHPTQSAGGRSTDYDDYPKEKTAYAMRSADLMIVRAGRHGDQLGHFMECLLAGDFPWARLRQAHKLLRLVDKYGVDRMEAACQRALSFDLINVNRVERIVQHGFEAEGAAAPPNSRSDLVQAQLRFQRDNNSFTHGTDKEETDGDQQLS